MVLDLDHDQGEAIDADAASVRCSNDHRRVSARRMGAGVQLRPPPDSSLERSIGAQRSLAESLRANADGLDRRADDLERLVAALDAAGVDWRNLPGVRP